MDEIKSNSDKETAQKMDRMKDRLIKDNNMLEFSRNISSLPQEQQQHQLDKRIKRMQYVQKRLSIYDRIIIALNEKIDIDPGRLIGSYRRNIRNGHYIACFCGGSA